MKTAIQLIRSVLHIITIYVAMAVLGIGLFPWALFSRRGAYVACHSWCRFVVWTLRWMVGLKTEVRGTPPTDEVIVAGKHQSFLDIIMIFGSVPRGKFIMKREILWTPFVGQYGLKLGCVPVNRGKRAVAIKKMMEDVKSGRGSAGQLIIYPQGTRVPPGVDKPYKVGTGVLYDQLQQACVPVGCNVGVFWPKRGLMRKQGTAVIEFLPRIPAGKPIKEFMTELEDVIETNSNALMAEAGFFPPRKS